MLHFIPELLKSTAVLYNDFTIHFLQIWILIALFAIFFPHFSLVVTAFTLAVYSQSSDSNWVCVSCFKYSIGLRRFNVFPRIAAFFHFSFVVHSDRQPKRKCEAKSSTPSSWIKQRGREKREYLKKTTQTNKRQNSRLGEAII